MTTSESEPALVTIRAIAQVPLPKKTAPIQEDGPKERWFQPDEVTISYVQEYTDPHGIDEAISPWDITAVVAGRVLTSGTAGARRSNVTYRDDPEAQTLPAWLQQYVDRYHPAKRP